MNNEIKSFFSFSKKELNGILILLTIIIPILLLPELVKILYDPPTYDFTESKKEIEEFLSDTVPVFKEKQMQTDRIRNLKTASYFNFDPNLATKADWIKMGLSQKQVNVILNYRNKGGRFYTKQDLRKIYSITDELYRKLEPFMVFSSVRQKEFQHFQEKSSSWKEQKTPMQVSVEINTADSAHFESLRGIGPVLASRIIKFRGRVGGFHSIEQLKEVYGIDTVLYNSLLPFLQIEPTLITKIEINTINAEELKGRTSLTYKQVNAIIQYRKQHGSFSNANDLLKIQLLNEEIIRKIEPYLAF